MIGPDGDRKPVRAIVDLVTGDAPRHRMGRRAAQHRSRPRSRAAVPLRAVGAHAVNIAPQIDVQPRSRRTCGTRTRSSIRSTSRRSPTATTTASATSRASPSSSTICRTSASMRSGCCRSIRVPAATTATTSPTTGASIPISAHMRDFKRFMTEAHRRGLRVITELVVNHTSDQHPWFKRARREQRRHRRAQLVRLERHRPEVFRHAHHLHRHREIELDLGVRRPAPITGTASSRTSRT